MGELFRDRTSKTYIGQISATFPADNRYEVNIYGATVTCRYGETGVDNPLTKGDTVLCMDTPLGWTILCKFPMPVAPSEDAQQSLSQILAKAAQEFSTAGNPQPGVSNKPSFQEETDNVPVFGDAILKSRVSKSFVGIFSDTTILLKSASILFMGLLSRFRAAVITCGRFFLNVIPGFSLKIWDVPRDSTPKVGDGEQAQQQDERVTRIEASLAYKSGTDQELKDRDIAFFAGGLRDWEDLGYGQSAITSGKKMTRGIRMKIRDFGMFESDHENREMRVTYLKDPAESPGLFQFRINKDEVVLAWGDQFMSLNQDGLFIKAKVIGLGGPWVMWDPTEVNGFTHDKSPANRTPICEWSQGTAKGGPGIKFAKSVYFSGNGVFQSHAFFGAQEEPAVLKPFLDVYTQDLAKLMTHTHTFVPPAGPVLFSSDLTALAEDIIKVNTDVYLKS